MVVRAARLEARALVEALERGDFYASTGVELADYQVTPQRMTVSVKATASSKYRIQFIGKGGRALREVTEPTATYEIRGDEGYVPARVLESNGRMAWCQPILVAPQPSARAEFGWILIVGIAVWTMAARLIQAATRTSREPSLTRASAEA